MLESAAAAAVAAAAVAVAVAAAAVAVASFVAASVSQFWADLLLSCPL